MAGLDIVQSYEWWSSAVNTHEKNVGSKVVQADIRQLQLESLPKDIQIVIGSPPCTEFSYSNRGGSGDIENGLVDITKFLEIVAYLKPKFWAMENVPRVKAILDKELMPGGVLSRFRSLGIHSDVVDMSEYGVPQRRKRCIAGNFDFDLLKSYRSVLPKRTLGQVVSALYESPVKDPIYGVTWPKERVNDNQEEVALNDEEVRYNREWKSHHPVYNDMQFPDSMDEPVRTITATCTRVSRESVVILNGGGRYRRLSVRERGCLQSFPVGYQFHGANYQKKIKMIGNAIPPLFTFYVAQAMCGVPPEKLVSPEEGIKRHSFPTEDAPRTATDKEGQTYPATRRFWFAIPGLRFKSGFRFELANENPGTDFADWPVRFWYGNSKDIRNLELRSAVFHRIIKRASLRPVLPKVNAALASVESLKGSVEAGELQRAWAHKGAGTHPFEVIDKIGEIAREVATILSEIELSKIEEIVLSTLELDTAKTTGGKARRYAREILAGILVGARFNTALFRRSEGHNALEAGR
jgi:DNA (cytosine-5)-methyltransferase 1